MSGYTGDYSPFGFGSLPSSPAQPDPWHALLMHVMQGGALSAIPVQADVSEAPMAPSNQRGLAELLGQPPTPEMQAAFDEFNRRLEAQQKPDQNLSRPPDNGFLAPMNQPFYDAPRYLPEQIPGDITYPSSRTGGRT